MTRSTVSTVIACSLALSGIAHADGASPALRADAEKSLKDALGANGNSLDLLNGYLSDAHFDVKMTVSIDASKLVVGKDHFPSTDTAIAYCIGAVDAISSQIAATPRSARSTRSCSSPRSIASSATSTARTRRGTASTRT